MPAATADPSPALETAEFLLERLERLHRARARQAKRRIPLACARTEPALRAFAEQHFLRMRELEARTLVEWADHPDRARLYRSQLRAEEIVALQAEGRRCVSLLEQASLEQGITFALHDLRHLGKFFDPVEHLSQKGFFMTIGSALSSSAWQELDSLLDERWRNDRNSVLADMNGAPVFLFSILKMKLKMAARRRHATLTSAVPPSSGALSEPEARSFHELLELCLSGMNLPAEIGNAARVISSRRDAAEHARGFREYFEAVADRRDTTRRKLPAPVRRGPEKFRPDV